jgi:hypothetical protein
LHVYGNVLNAVRRADCLRRRSDCKQDQLLSEWWVTTLLVKDDQQLTAGNVSAGHMLATTGVAWHGTNA